MKHTSAYRIPRRPGHEAAPAVGEQGRLARHGGDAVREDFAFLFQRGAGEVLGACGRASTEDGQVPARVKAVLQGLMQGFWLAATAVGNALLFVGGWLYMHTPMWATWCVFVAACGMSMLVMLSMVRWLERVTK